MKLVGKPNCKWYNYRTDGEFQYFDSSIVSKTSDTEENVKKERTRKSKGVFHTTALKFQQLRAWTKLRISEIKVKSVI